LLSRQNEFFSFVEEREQIRLRKKADLPFPWTDDPILQEYKFTNVHRHHDRTSLILRGLFYTPNFSDDPKTVLMNAATYRYFGTYEFAEVVGWVDYESMDDSHWESIKEIAEDRLANKERVFTGAYVITNGGISAPKYEVVVDHYLKPLYEAAPRLIRVAKDTESWESVATEMRKLQGFGGSGFMTKEILMDTTYCGFWKDEVQTEEDDRFSFPSDWWDWTPIGPGARRGASRVGGDDSATPLKESLAGEVIAGLMYNQELFLDEDKMGKLCPHDIQFQLCEFDKYERVRLGQGRPRSKYKRS
jgi:hypothetical protein